MTVTQTPRTPILYKREGAYIPRIAAVHDLCGYGKCSLGVAIPVLSAAGADVCPVPTGLFSSHTAFPGWYMHDTTDILADYLAAWKGIDVEIDAVYSGFLGAPEQVDIIRDIYATYPDALRVVDPVMADHGQVYPTYTPELCQAMADLACEADILTPNLTEAAIILGREWTGTDITDEQAKELIDALLAKGAKNVVLIATCSKCTTSSSRTCCTARATCTARACSRASWPASRCTNRPGSPARSRATPSRCRPSSPTSKSAACPSSPCSAKSPPCCKASSIRRFAVQ